MVRARRGDEPKSPSGKNLSSNPSNNLRDGEEGSSSENRCDDSLWKEMLTNLFLPMLRSVLPEMAAAVDTSRSVTFLDKEEQQPL